MRDANFWIKQLGLEPHPEGGYFKEVYRSPETFSVESVPGQFSGERSLSTSIYFLITGKKHSKFHRLKSDEIWHFYDGNPVNIYILDPIKSTLQKITLGKEIEKEQFLQFTIPKNNWFAARIVEPNGYSLVGCTVSPGFEYVDFEMGNRDQLLNQFPLYQELINALT